MQWLDKVLEQGEAYAVGGSVRDELLGRPVNDLDILVCGIAPKILEKLLKAEGQLHLVGKFFGVYLFKPRHSDISFEIALPRTEESTGDGHKAFDVRVNHTLPIETDLKRRDFTINAMAKSLRDDKLIDPWGGQNDLKAGLIRQVFNNTFNEDPLRMLRACQFAARLNFTLETDTLQGIKDNAELVTSLSVERVLQELQKLLKAPEPSIGLRLMQETGLMQFILPELTATVGIEQPSQYHKHDVFNHILAVIDAVDLSLEKPAPDDGARMLEIRWAALCHDLGKPIATGNHAKNGRPTFYGHENISERLADELLSRLRTPEALKQKVKILCQQHMFQHGELSDRALRRLIHRTGPDNMLDLLHLRRADMIGSGVKQDLDSWEILFDRTVSALDGGTFNRKQLAISGQDLIKQLDIKPGPRIGVIVDELLARVLDDPALNTRDQLLRLAEQLAEST